MEASISKAVYDAGQKLAVSTGSLADALNQTLNQFLVWPFRATKGSAIDSVCMGVRPTQAVAQTPV